MNTQSITELPSITSFQPDDRILVARLVDDIEKTYISHGITYSDISNAISSDIAKIKLSVALGKTMVELKENESVAPTGKLHYELYQYVKERDTLIENINSNALFKNTSEIQTVTTPILFNNISSSIPTNNSHVATKIYVDRKSPRLLFSYSNLTDSINKSLNLLDMSPLDYPGNEEKNYTAIVTFRLTSNTTRTPTIKVNNGSTELTVKRYVGNEKLTKDSKIARYYCEMTGVKPSNISITIKNSASDVNVFMHVFSGLLNDIYYN